MKRIFLLLFALSLFSGLRASDTLTIRQIYNFDVGDTFDYYLYGTVSAPYMTVYSNYERQVIISKSIAADSITYIVANTIFNSDTHYSAKLDSVLIVHLDSNSIDTQLLFFPTGYLFQYTNVNSNGNLCYLIDSASNGFFVQNWDSIGNDIWCNGNGVPVYYFVRCQKGLGMTYYHRNNNDGADPIVDDYAELIYYTKGNTHAGTPYYNSTLGINNPSNISDAKVYPNPASDQLWLSVKNAGQINAQFIITDILGRQVYSSPVTQSERSYDISGFSAGLYTWRIVSGNAIIKTGKVIKE